MIKKEYIKPEIEQIPLYTQQLLDATHPKDDTPTEGSEFGAKWGANLFDTDEDEIK